MRIFRLAERLRPAGRHLRRHRRGASRTRRRRSAAGRGDRPLDHDDDRPAHADRRRSSPARAARAAPWPSPSATWCWPSRTPIYSVITPEGCASILWRSAEAAPAGRRGDAPDRAPSSSRWASSMRSCRSRPAAPRRTPDGRRPQLRAAIIPQLDRLAGAVDAGAGRGPLPALPADGRLHRPRGGARKGRQRATRPDRPAAQHPGPGTAYPRRRSIRPRGRRITAAADEPPLREEL